MQTKVSEADLLLQTGEFAENAGAALAAARQLTEEIANEQVKQAELVPAALSMLQRAGLVPDLEVEEVRTKLASHSGALQIIGRMAGLMQRRQSKEAAMTGEPAPKIGAGVENGPGGDKAVVTRIRPGDNLSRLDIRPSDLPYLELLN